MMSAIFLLDANTGALKAVLDGTSLTEIRTAAGSGLATEVLADPAADVKAFAHAVARKIVRAAPRNFVDTMAKEFRKHRVYVDYLRNTRGATAVAPYSTRARPGACVSTPLAWDELSADRPPSSYTVGTVPDRLAGLEADPWEDVRRVRQSITAAMRRELGLDA